MAPPHFDDVIVDLADRGGAVVILERGAGAPVLSGIRRLASARSLNWRAPHHSVSPKTLTEEAAMASDGLLFLDEVDEFSKLARTKLLEYLENFYGGMVPMAVFSTVDTGRRSGQDLADAQAFAAELADAMDLEVVTVSVDGRVVGGLSPPSPLASRQARRDLAEINRHRAQIYQRPLDPEAAGWGPDDLAAEVKRIRALNPQAVAKERLLAW